MHQTVLVTRRVNQQLIADWPAGSMMCLGLDVNVPDQSATLARKLPLQPDRAWEMLRQENLLLTAVVEIVTPIQALRPG